MKRYIITGTPGCGKTSIIRALEMKGYFVIDEAATDVIAYEQAQGIDSPWEHSKFVDHVVHLQRQRQIQTTDSHPDLQFFDRSPICTYALSVYLNFEPSEDLMGEIQRIQNEHTYQKKVFFIENLGFIKPTDARKISYEDSLVFEKIHKDAYTKFGFESVLIPQGGLNSRVDTILKEVQQDLK